MSDISETYFETSATARKKRRRAEPRFALKASEDGKSLLLVYSPDNGVDFVDAKFQGDNEDATIGIKGIFTFRREDVLDIGGADKTIRTFVLGVSDTSCPDYWRVDARKLDLRNDVLLAKDSIPKLKWFAPLYIYQFGNVTVLDKIDKLVSEDIVIGGTHERAISQEDWENILLHFPTATETGHYCNSRIEALIRDYFSELPDSQKKLSEYLDNRKKKIAGRTVAKKGNALDSEIAEYEVEKYSFVLERLQELLKDDTVSEREWEEEILKLLLLIYPRYIAVLEQVAITEYLTNLDGTAKKRLFDLVLVDADGHIDLIEIKKPSAGSPLRNTTDHDNAIPSSLLTKAVMQAEKYILYLQKGGYQLEKKLNAAYKDKLPAGVKIRVVNPKAIVILGRRDFDPKYTTDFEVIRRKYANIADILTYDDLLDYFRNIISRFRRGEDNEKSA